MVTSALGVMGVVTVASSAAPSAGSAATVPVASPGPSTTLLAPAETLVPTSGPSGTLVTLTGTGFNVSQIYYYCFETTNTHIGCPSTLQFTTTAAGAIPTGVNFTLTAAEYVVIATGTLSGQFVVDAHFTLQTMTVEAGNVPYVIQRPEFQFLFTNTGPVAGNVVLNLTLFLTETNLSYLEVLVSELNTPGTPQYHQYMTPSAFQKEFYPTNTTINNIENYYRQHGFKVWSYSYSPLTIVVEANVSVIDTQFAVTMYNYNVNLTYAELENSYNYGTLSNPVMTINADPSVPSTYASQITSIYGLSYASDIDLLKSAITACGVCSLSGTPAGTLPGQGGVMMTQDAGTSTTNVVSGSSSLLLPAQLQAYYGLTPLVSNGYNGTGQKVGIIGVGQNFVSVADEIKAANTLGIYPRNVYIVNLTANGLNTAPSGAEQELDLEMVEFTSPGASIYDVQAAFNLSTGYHNSQKGSLGDDSVMMEIYYLLNVVDPNTITSSWGMLQFQHGTAWATTYVQMGLQATAEGVTYFEGSSDSHSVYYLIGEDSQYFMSVGGVDPVLSSTGTILGQYAWYQPSGSFYGLQEGTGGGQSFFYPKPAYQVSEAVTVPATYINRTMPDLSFPALSVGYSGNGNSFSGGGGTSFSAPIMAGAFADMESMMAARNGVTQYQLGWMQPILYNLGYGTTYGYTAYTAVSYLQPSGTIADGSYLGNGWNEWTGLGTPNMINMTYDFMNYIAAEKLTAQLGSNVVLQGGSTTASLTVTHFGAAMQLGVSVSLGGVSVLSWTTLVNSASATIPINVSTLLPGVYTVVFSYQAGSVMAVTSCQLEITSVSFVPAVVAGMTPMSGPALSAFSAVPGQNHLLLAAAGRPSGESIHQAASG
jgi:subtilase family serine protease